jgi:tRNA dimethylallyltransferase
MDRSLPSAIFVMGPTASGKTDLAVALARELPVDVISVDSALVYRGMDIGTAKPEPELLTEVPHALVDILDPEESYSAARFREDALARMEASRAAGRVPLLVGGTMLYYHALQHGLSDLPSADPELRARLQARLAEEGSAALHAELARLDPVAAARIHPNDPQRLLRALEVIERSGRPLSELQAGCRGEALRWRVLKLVRAPQDRQVLHERIARRFHRMLELGFEEEVAHLLARPGIHPELPSMRAVGYRQMAAYLLGNCTREEMVERGIVATRQLAKRQFTWLRREEEATWLEDGKRVVEKALRLAADFLKDSSNRA